MKKIYVIFPVIGVLLFAVVFWRFNADFDAREKAKANVIRLEHEAKMQADFELKKKAVEDAIVLQEQRKAEKLARKERDEAEKQAQIDLNDAKDKARDDLSRVVHQVDRLKAEILVEEGALAKIETEKAGLIAEDAFLQKYVTLAEANRKSLEEVLTKIDIVDKAAAVLAAQSAKKKS